MIDNLIMNLKESEERLMTIATQLNVNSAKLNEIEQKVILLKAKLVGSAEIHNLPNQAMRDAEIENRLQTDEKYEPIYREYLELKTENRKLYILWNLYLELNKNNRVLLMNGGNYNE